MAQDTLYDIYDFYQAPWWHSPIIIACIIAAATVVLGLAIYFYYRKKPLTHWEQALISLNRLDPSSFKHKQEFKQFYFELTNIIKPYLENRYGWKIAMLTDEELCIWLANEHPDSPCVQTFSAMQEHALLIKFANVDAIATHALRDKQALIDLVNATKPTP
jgi:hypothetical protein